MLPPVQVGSPREDPEDKRPVKAADSCRSLSRVFQPTTNLVLHSSLTEMLCGCELPLKEAGAVGGIIDSPLSLTPPADCKKTHHYRSWQDNQGYHYAYHTACSTTEETFNVLLDFRKFFGRFSSRFCRAIKNVYHW